MSTTPPNVLQLARQGDPDAIAALMNRHLETQGITAHVVQQESTLQVDLEGAQIPSQVDLVAFVKKGITGLELAAIQRLTIRGKQAGATASAWSEDLVLQTATSDFELDFDATPGDAIAADAPASDDLDLDFDLDSTALDTTDLGDLDAALGNDLNGADLDLDLGLTNSDLGLEAPADLEFNDSDFGLDLTDAGAGPEVADSFDLDLSDAGSGPDFADDLDLGLSDDLATDLTADNGFDLDLGLSEETPPDPNSFDLDLGLPEETPADPNSFDLDLGLSDEPQAEPIDLDFDLGLTEAGAQPPTDSTDLDFDLGITDGPAEGESPADLDFDMDFDAEPAAASDLDFDLGTGDSATDASNDLDLGWIEEPAAGSSATDSTEELDLDFGTAAEPEGDLSAAELDFDLGLTDTPTAASTADDLELDTADFDLGFDPEAAGSEASLGASDDLDLDFGTELDPAGDLDLANTNADFEGTFGTEAFETENFGTDNLGIEELGTEPGAETFGTEEFGAIAEIDTLETDGSAFDLNAPPPPLTAPEVEADLDDLWGDSDTSAIAPESAAADLSAIDDLAAFDTDLTVDGESSEAGLDEWSDLGAISEDLEPEAPETDADAIAFADLGLETEAPSLETTDSIDDLPPDLLMDQPAFEDLGAAEDLDLAADLDLTDDWATASPEFSLGEANTGLSDAASLDLSNAESAEDSAAALDTPFTDDFGAFDPAAENDLPSDLLSEDALATDWSAAAPDLSADLGTDFNADWAESASAELGTDSTTPPWEDPTNDFDPDLALNTPGDADNIIPEFDPGLVFDPSAEATDAAPNPFVTDVLDDDPYTFAAPEFETDAGGMDAFTADSTPGFEPEFASEADADLPFSTMELDQTAAGNMVPNMALDDSPIDLDAYDETYQQPEAYAVEPAPAPMEFGDDADDDLAFESVEFDGDDFGSSGFETPGFSVGGFNDEPDFAAPAFEEEGFSNAASFDNEGFDNADFDNQDFGNQGFDNEAFGAAGLDANIFSDSHEDSNGLIQDRNGSALMEDEPDATDDFIQEFGSDPSTHVALTPDQFNDDGSVRRSGSSGLPLRLIVGLGLGALVLALAGFLLNGVLNRLRSPEGNPAVTQPVPNPDALPADPAAVAEEDLFRQAVNAAQTAANEAQTASTSAEWQNVADTWALAIDLMQRVPASDPNYATAQQKAVDYQPNFNYAQQNAEQLR
ncbi:hypothetical protein C7293_11890 [filamentous cyanobacterium CCT1]|nr:hypothetical protein C7293_11890 [filamentous cyanobacterium CCT1]PSN78884.1 hypothetical protein C8B47_14640 [filamentous cyanobacterium CCP4]